MRQFHFFLGFCFLFLGIACADGQNNIAFAYPVEDINIDGSLEDWPQELPWYQAKRYYGPNGQSNEDCVVLFKAGYGRNTNDLYVAVTVLDDEIIGTDGNEFSHMSQDHAILYLDENHRPEGGAPLYFVVAQDYLEIVKNQASWDEGAPDLNREDIEVKVLHLRNRIQYEWKIRTKNRLNPNMSLGIDHFIIDQDPGQSEQLNVLWKDGFGKSMSSNRIGDLLLVDDNTKFGSIKGRMDMSALEPAERINEVAIQSTEVENLWMKVHVDSNGYYECKLPTGKFGIYPINNYSSPIGSSGFKQNTRKLIYSNLDTFSINANQQKELKRINVITEARPALQRKKGLLLSTEKTDEKEIEDYILEWKDYLNIPGVSIALIKDNQLVFDRNYGIKNVITQEPLTSKTLFEAASITKAVFGVMVLKLAEKGVIDLDKPLFEYLPFPNIEADERSLLLTARIILGHQSGLPNWAWGGPGTWSSGGPIRLGFTPGTEFGYSGEAFNYLGRVIEHLTGNSLAQIFEEEVATPFGLENSYFYFTDDQRTEMAQGHYRQFPNFKTRERVPSPASSISTNAHDFWKFAMGLMNERHLSKKSYELIYSAYTELRPDQKIYDPQYHQHVSHGFFVQKTPEKTMIGHGGNNGDFDCKFAYDPVKKFGYVIFTNSNLGDEFIRQIELFLLQE